MSEWIKHIRWNAEGVKPADDSPLYAEGFESGYKPPAHLFNYFFNQNMQIIDQLQDKFDKKTPIVAQATSNSNEHYTATVEGYKEYNKGDVVIFIPDVDCTACSTTYPTLNINGMGAIPLRRQGANGGNSGLQIMSGHLLKAGIPHILCYDGTYFVSSYIMSIGDDDFYKPVGMVSGGTGKSYADWYNNNIVYINNKHEFSQIDFPTKESILTQTTTGAPYWTAKDTLASAEHSHELSDITDWIDKENEMYDTIASSYASIDLSNVDNDTFKAKVEESGFTTGVQNLVDGTGNGAVKGKSATEASTTNSFAFGSGAVARGGSAIAFGSTAKATGVNSVAIGNNVTAQGMSSIAMGDNSNALLPGAYAIGCNVTVDANYAFATGYNTYADGNHSFVAGKGTRTVGAYSGAIGLNTEANSYQFVTGKYNKKSTGSTYETDTTGDAFIVGNGTADDARGNALRTTMAGKTYGLSSFTGSGADYAEMWEIEGGNPNNEDWRGYFVTVNENNKIQKATSEDDYILGVISATPMILGDSQSEEWHGRYLRDVFGEKLIETVEVEETTDEDENIIPAHTEKRWVLNPEYDSTQEYISRENRPEWAAVGLLGKLVVKQDGTCKAGKYCTVGNGGIATASEIGYRVLKVIDNEHIQIMFR